MHCKLRPSHLHGKCFTNHKIFPAQRLIFFCSWTRAFISLFLPPARSLPLQDHFLCKVSQSVGQSVSLSVSVLPSLPLSQLASSGMPPMNMKGSGTLQRKLGCTGPASLSGICCWLTSRCNFLGRYIFFGSYFLQHLPLPNPTSTLTPLTHLPPRLKHSL